MAEAPAASVTPQDKLDFKKILPIFVIVLISAPLWFWAALMGLLAIVAMRGIASDRQELAPLPA